MNFEQLKSRLETAWTVLTDKKIFALKEIYCTAPGCISAVSGRNYFLNSHGEIEQSELRCYKHLRKDQPRNYDANHYFLGGYLLAKNGGQKL